MLCERTEPLPKRTISFLPPHPRLQMSPKMGWVPWSSLRQCVSVPSLLEGRQLQTFLMRGMGWGGEGEFPRDHTGWGGDWGWSRESNSAPVPLREPCLPPGKVPLLS